MVLASSQSRKNGKQKSWQISSHLVLCQQRLLFRENVASARRVIRLANACWIVRFSPQINSTCCTRAFIVASFFTALSRQRVDGFPVLKLLFRISHYLSLTVGHLKLGGKICCKMLSQNRGQESQSWKCVLFCSTVAQY